MNKLISNLVKDRILNEAIGVDPNISVICWQYDTVTIVNKDGTSREFYKKLDDKVKYEVEKYLMPVTPKFKFLFDLIDRKIVLTNGVKTIEL